MNELEVLNLVTSIIAQHAVTISHPAELIKYPNTDIDLQNNPEFVEVLFTIYTGQKINLKGNKRIFGCLTFKVMSERGIGMKKSIDLAMLFAQCLSGKIIEGIVFDEYDLLILDHTLSQTQTTTDIPSNQVNVNIEFSFMR